MAGEKKKITDNSGKTHEGTVVPVLESSERFSDVRLGDGTLIRIKASVVEALRAEGEYDQDGNPVYIIQSTNIVRISEVPDGLKRKLQS